MRKIIIALVIFSSCSQESKKDESAQAAREIMDADIAMSNLATKEGFFKALLAYAEDSMVISREGKLPLMSKAEATAEWKEKPVITVLTWKPVKAEASTSGDMGYTFGFSTYQGADTTTYTSYCTVWRKQKDGSWKFLYDGGNNTLKPNN